MSGDYFDFEDYRDQHLDDGASDYVEDDIGLGFGQVMCDTGKSLQVRLKDYDGKAALPYIPKGQLSSSSEITRDSLPGEAGVVRVSCWWAGKAGYA